MAQTILWAVRITTNDGTGSPIPISESSRGIIGGQFHFLTGDTDFLEDQDLSGDGIVGTNDQYWYTGFIIKDSLGNPVREVDIVDGGSWGSISGWAFSLENTNTDMQAFWAWARETGIDFVNRRVDLYAFVQADSGEPWVSYQRWSGFIATDPFTATEFVIQCSGTNPANEKQYPPNVITSSTYPGINPTVENSILPVSLGYVKHAAAVRVTSPTPVAVSILSSGPAALTQTLVYSTFAVAYRTPVGESPYLVLWTPQISFAEGELNGYYLQFEGASVNISGNSATSTGAEPTGYGIAYLTRVFLSAPLPSDITEDNFANEFENAPDAWAADAYYYKGQTARHTSPDFVTWVSLQNNNIDHEPGAVGSVTWWGQQRAIIAEYSGKAGQLLFYATTTPPYSLGSGTINGTYLIGETSGAAGIYTGASNLMLTVRGVFQKQERVYLSTGYKYYAIIKNDTNGTLGPMDNVRGWVSGFNVAVGDTIYAGIVMDGPDKKFVLSLNPTLSGSGNWVAYSLVTGPGVLTLTPLTISGLPSLVRGTVEIYNTLLTPTGFGVFPITVDLFGITVSTILDRNSATLTNIVLESFTAPTSTGINSVFQSMEYFSLFRNYLNYLASQAAISGYVTTDTMGYASIYDSDTGEYVDVTSFVQGNSTTGDAQYQSPYVALASGQAQEGARFLVYSPLVPSVASFDIAADIVEVPELVDKDRSTYVTLTGAPIGSNAAGVSFSLKIFPTDQLFNRQFEAIFAALDMEVTTGGVAFYYDDFRILYFDKNGLQFYETNSFGFPLNGLSFTPGVLNNMLPNLYYANGGNDEGEQSQFASAFFDQLGTPVGLSSRLQMPDEIAAQKGTEFGFAAFVVSIRTPPQASQAGISVNIKQAGFVGSNFVDVSQTNLYLSMIGEMNNDATPVTNIYNAFGWFQYKDGLVPTWTDAQTNLAPIATQFPIGRQLTTQRTSREWLTEMARQAFFCVFPDRQGRQNAVNWLIRTGILDVTFEDDADNIVSGSFSLEKSNYRRLWNTFTFLYNWDPGAGKYSRRLAIQKPDASAFPGKYVSTGYGDAEVPFASITARFEGGVWVAYVVSFEGGIQVGDIFSFYGSDIGISIYFSPVTSFSVDTYRIVMEQNFSGSGGIPSSGGTWYKQASATPAWTDYVSGLPGSIGWQPGKELWEFCHESYLKTLSIQPAPSDITELSWFVDLNDFYDSAVAQSYENFAAYAIANFHARYTTRQRDIYSYSVPMSPVSLVRDLLEYGTVTDYVFTEDEARFGWVFRLEDDIKQGVIHVRAMERPDVALDSTNIIETGSAEIEIDESGTRETDVVETGES